MTSQEKQQLIDAIKSTDDSIPEKELEIILSEIENKKLPKSNNLDILEKLLITPSLKNKLTGILTINNGNLDSLLKQLEKLLENK